MDQTMMTIGTLEMEIIHALMLGGVAWAVWVTRSLFRVTQLVTKVELLEVKAELIEEIRKGDDL